MFYLIVIVLFIILYLSSKNKYSKSNIPTIYYYYSPQCKYCVKMSPHYYKAKSMTLLKNPSYKFKELNTNDPKNQNNYIEGVPTILKVVHKKIYTYDGPVCSIAITKWINN